MQQEIRRIPSLPPAPDQATAAARRHALESGLADAPESGIEKKRREAKATERTTEAPKAETGTDQNAENLKKLEGKLGEYKARLAALDRKYEGVDEATQSKNPERIDAQCKIAAAEYYLKNGNMDESAVADILRAQGVPFKEADLDNACGVIEVYVKRGGLGNFGGTGLDGKRREGSPDMTEEEFAADFKEAEADLAREDALDKTESETEKARAEAEAGWQERVAEYEATKNQDIIGETIREAQQEAAKAESVAAKKTGKVISALGDTLTFSKNLFIDTPAALYTYLREGAEDFTHDLSDATLGTTATDKMKGWWRNMFGKQNSETRMKGVHIDAEAGTMEDVNEQHRGAREIPGIAWLSMREFPRALWEQVSAMPGNIGTRLYELSPEKGVERSEIARTVEESAWAELQKVLASLDAEEKALRSGGASESDLKEALERLQDKKDIAHADYSDELKKSKEISPERGVGHALLSGSKDIASYLAMDDLLAEMGQNLVKGLAEARRKTAESRNPNVPYSKDMVATWGPQERAMTIMERLGDWISGRAEVALEARQEHAEALNAEVKTAAQKEANIYQDAMSGRIEALTQKTKLTKEDRGEIAYLSAKLALARQGLTGASELAAAIKRAEAFAQRVEARKDDEQLLMGYLAGRAINVIRGIDTMTGPEGKALIAELQEKPSPISLRRAEALVYEHLDRELKGPAESLLTNEQKVKLQEAHAVLKESVGRATEMYQNSIAGLTKELTKGLQTADREMKKATVEAEQAHDESNKMAA